MYIVASCSIVHGHYICTTVIHHQSVERWMIWWAFHAMSTIDRHTCPGDNPYPWPALEWWTYLLDMCNVYSPVQMPRG